MYVCVYIPKYVNNLLIILIVYGMCVSVAKQYSIHSDNTQMHPVRYECNENN